MAADPATFRPTVGQLGGIMRARTRDAMGNELGTFTADTRPTAVEVEGVIDIALPLVAARLGSVPDRLAGMALSLVVLRTAMLVETSYFAEETGSEESAYASYRDQYRDALADFDTAATGDAGQARQKIASLSARTIYTSSTTPPEDLGL